MANFPQIYLSINEPSAQMVRVRLSAKVFFSLLYVFFFRFVFVVNYIFPFGLFPFILSLGPFEPRKVFSLNAFQVMFYITLAHSSIVHALPIEISVNHLGSSESTQIKSQNDRPSPEIPH